MFGLVKEPFARKSSLTGGVMNNKRVCIIGENAMGMDIAQARAEASLEVIDFLSTEQL